MGMPLFHRTCTGVYLNHAGMIFHDHVIRYVNGLTKCISDLKNEFGNGCPSFALGYSSLLGYTILPDVINEFKKNHKNISLNIYEGQLSTLLPLVNAGTIDCAIGTLSENNPLNEYYIEKLFHSQFSIFSSCLHPLSHARTFEELTSANWVLPGTQFGYYHKLNEFLADNDVNIHAAIRTDSISSILNLVYCADYLTILASPMGEGRNKKLALHKIATEKKLPSADYYIVWSKNFIPSVLLEKFMTIIKGRCSTNSWGQ